MLIAVVYAYKANDGVPLKSKYRLSIELKDAANLVVGNEVRMAGARVGTIEKIEPKTQPNGENIAVMSLKLDKEVGELPKDSTFLVRPRSLLGLKYLQITRGDSAAKFKSGATVPLANARPEPVEFDQVLDTFDRPTREAVKTNLEGFGDAFAGRGRELNRSIEDLPHLLKELEKTSRTLALKETNLGGFISSMGSTFSELSQVANDQADLFANTNTTFSALASVSDDLAASIRSAPQLLNTVSSELPKQRPFLRNATQLAAKLRPGLATLPASSSDLASITKNGTVMFENAVGLNKRLATSFTTLKEFSEDPQVSLGLVSLTETMDSLQPTLAFVKPSQTVCNYVSLFFRNIASAHSETDSTGTFQRFGSVIPPEGPNSEGGPASAPADGPEKNNYLHVNPYPYTASPGQPKECEAGNIKYQAGKTVIGNPESDEGKTTEKIAKSKKGGE